ncbi:lipocalin [Photobacterium sanctipauli]|uniref:Outer membrane lipoprotein Blc n=1 Tax=Photobacterium sanctipauli TaxID=1342794 RepID=A0A2T3NZK3_9GAMM|nr:lipocalin family protein [Photobacterium sanctipauli]PSW21694.1 lipocalin [Photobacterium sanctipauli]
MKSWIFVISTLFLSGCLGMPREVAPVKNFELERYLGKWYEIARLDHSFEKGMTKVTAEYFLRDDGGVSVINRGYFVPNQRWKQADGKAYFVESSDKGYLKVSFFGPFYGSYVVFELDDDYQYAFISGPNLEYLWLLARTPTVDQQVIDAFITTVKDRGFNTDELIFVEH